MYNEIFPFANIIVGILIFIVGFIFHWFFQLISAINWNYATKIGVQEKEMIPEKVYLGKNDTPIKWFKAAKVRHDKWVDMKRHFPGDPGVFYGNTFVFSEIKQTVQLRLGTSGALKVFLNDNLVYSYRDENNNDLRLRDNNVIPVQ